MKKIFFSLLTLAFLSNSVSAQDSSAVDIARDYMRAGDWDNASLVLNRALLADPSNLTIQKDLALALYYKKDYSRALELSKKMLDRDDADIQVYQISGNIYKALEEVKEADKMYRKGIKKFPGSGPLYSEYGELLWASKNFDAIKIWEKGIEQAPSFAGNYYNAALYYYYTKDKVWTLIYGEIFVNMESLTERATGMKKLLLSAYKEKLFNTLDMTGAEQKPKSAFAQAVLQTLYKQANLVNKGINLETLTKVRTRFILDWYNTHGKKYPFRLFDFQQQLIKEGLFDSYNQWLFGTIENLPAFDQWTKANSEAYTKFANLQKARIFKMPQGQYYQEL